MKKRRPYSRMAVLLPGVLALMTLLAGCNESQPAPTPAPSTTSQKVYVQFEGPWIFVTDPKDSSMMLFIAPKAKGHRDLFVKASNGATLPSGTYDLAVPPRTVVAAGTRDRDIAQAKADPANIQRALDAKGARYAIRLPKPEAFLAAGRFRSRVGPTYPPDATTEKDYATELSLQYSVGSLSGFSLAGTADTGTFNPLLLQVETPLVRFVIEPDLYDDPADLCNLHSRASFHDLAKLVGLALYVDFPNDPADCHKKDPQNPYPAKSAMGSPSATDRLAAAAGASSERGQSDLARVTATLGNLAWLAAHGQWNDVRHQAMAAYYLFGHPAMDCRGPIIDGGP